MQSLLGSSLFFCGLFGGLFAKATRPTQKKEAFAAVRVPDSKTAQELSLPARRDRSVMTTDWTPCNVQADVDLFFSQLIYFMFWTQYTDLYNQPLIAMAPLATWLCISILAQLKQKTRISPHTPICDLQCVVSSPLLAGGFPCRIKWKPCVCVCVLFWRAPFLRLNGKLEGTPKPFWGGPGPLKRDTPVVHLRTPLTTKQVPIAFPHAK